MNERFQQPTAEKVGSNITETVESHPAYAQISASRVSGQTNLYGSDFSHQNYVTISIHASELHRSLSRDWAFSRREYIEVAMSESQWAAFVSSMNVGCGIQCTLSHLEGNASHRYPTHRSGRNSLAMSCRKRWVTPWNPWICCATVSKVPHWALVQKKQCCRG